MKTVGKLITLSTLAAGGAGLAGTAAYGYWATTGQGTGTATVGTLDTATSVAASAASNGLVHITWTAPVAPDGGTPTGYLVERVGGTTANACGSSSVALLSGPATSCDDTVPVAGAYTYRVTTFFRSWSAPSSASAPVTVVLDATAPSAGIGLAAGQSNPSGSGTVRFAVTFSEGVTGFDANDITVSGTAPGTKTTTVTPIDQANYTVAVSGITGSGTVIASVNGGAALGLANNPSTASPSSATVTVVLDTTAPTITSVTRLGASPANSSPVSFQVTFNETVLNVDAADFLPAVTGDFAGTATGITSVTGPGSIYTVVASTGSGMGNATLGLKLAAGPTINDAAGNAAAANGTATGTNEAYTLSAVTVTATATREAGPDTSNRRYSFAGTVGGSGGSVRVEIFGNAGATGAPVETFALATPSGTAWSTAFGTSTFKLTDAKSVRVTYTATNGRTVTITQTF